jgi:CheY-like chemotaxis protein
MIRPVSDVILYAEDDDNDAFLIQLGFQRAAVPNPIVVVQNGREAIDYLSGTGQYSGRAGEALPCLLLLDLKMPGVSGLEVLKWIRTTPSVSTLLVLMLTSSNQDADIHRAYLLGANGYLVKPSKIEDIITMAKAVKDYWLVQNQQSAWRQSGVLNQEGNLAAPGGSAGGL